LKWKSGLRVYAHRNEATLMIVLLGGNKNGQNKDIRQAQKIRINIQENGFEQA
jgi:putative component of toxin-antitoxin plasmid stabilization module